MIFGRRPHRSRRRPRAASSTHCPQRSTRSRRSPPLLRPGRRSGRRRRCRPGASAPDGAKSSARGPGNRAGQVGPPDGIVGPGGRRRGGRRAAARGPAGSRAEEGARKKQGDAFLGHRRLGRTGQVDEDRRPVGPRVPRHGGSAGSGSPGGVDRRRVPGCHQRRSPRSRPPADGPSRWPDRTRSPARVTAEESRSYPTNRPAAVGPTLPQGRLPRGPRTWHTARQPPAGRVRGRPDPNLHRHLRCRRGRRPRARRPTPRSRNPTPAPRARSPSPMPGFTDERPRSPWSRSKSGSAGFQAVRAYTATDRSPSGPAAWRPTQFDAGSGVDAEARACPLLPSGTRSCPPPPTVAQPPPGPGRRQTTGDLASRRSWYSRPPWPSSKAAATS